MKREKITALAAARAAAAASGLRLLAQNRGDERPTLIDSAPLGPW
jgi:hypothetical protein